MGALVWPLLGVLAGAMFAVQAPVNAILGRAVGSPVVAAGISFFAGAIALTLVSFVLVQGQGTMLDWRAPSWWMLIVGGVLGAFVVTCNVILAPKIGAAALMACLVSGQLIAGIVLDRIGFLGLPVHEITTGRVAGALMLLAGALLVRFT